MSHEKLIAEARAMVETSPVGTDHPLPSLIHRLADAQGKTEKEKNELAHLVQEIVEREEATIELFKELVVFVERAFERLNCENQKCLTSSIKIARLETLQKVLEIAGKVPVFVEGAIEHRTPEIVDKVGRMLKEEQ